MVCVRGLAASIRQQLRIGILYDALRAEIWEGSLRELVGVHDYLLFPECPRPAAIEGEEKFAIPLHSSSVFQMCHSLCSRKLNFTILAYFKLDKTFTVILLPQMLCLALFFALVIKKVDEDDFQNMEFERNLGKKMNTPKIHFIGLTF